MKTLCTYDYSYFRMLRKHFGDDKAFEMHREAWLRNIPDYLDQGKKVYDLEEPIDLPGFGYLLKYAFNQQGCRFDITESRGGRFVAYMTNRILAEYANERFPPEGDPVYEKSVDQIHRALVDELAKVTNLADKLEYTISAGKLVISLR